VAILRMIGPSDPELRSASEVIDRQVGVMARLLDDLFDVSRITRNKLVLRKERVGLRDVIQVAVETSRPLIEAGGLDLSVTLPDGQVLLDADPTRLSQVFSNLLNNACKYTERGGAIRLTTECQDGQVIVSVRDTGIGIAAENLPHLFGMFSQVEPVLERSQGGLGIGLALVRRLVEMHGGTVEARSEGLGTGSEFLVRLPVISVSCVTAPAGTAPVEGSRAKSQEKFRILVVDDNRVSTDTLATLLRYDGHEVQTAYDGVEGVEAFGSFHPDVIVLDIGMPRLNGYDAARQIRERALGKSVVLIALTGWAQESDRSQSQKSGFDHHLIKPVDPESLLDLIAGLKCAPVW
jgi:CheY-like chemotaxis protein/two-component sensor histidine kinase